MSEPSNKRIPNSAKELANQILRSKVLIFVMLFGVTGFLGLPILWISPVFSKLEKVFWSVINTMYTCALIWICVIICSWAYGKFLEL